MIVSADEFLRLRASADPQDYQKSSQEEAPDNVWLEVVTRHPDMREWVAHNKTAPLSILKLLASGEDEHVRFQVAQKRKLTDDLFDLLSRDAAPSVRERIAWNAKTPRMILFRLANDVDERVAAQARRRLE